MKKKYQKPVMQVVLLQQRSHILQYSRGMKSITSTDNFTQKSGGFDDEEEDM